MAVIRRSIKIILYLVSAAVSAITLGSVLAGYISPDVFWPLALLGLLFLYLYGVNFILMAFWIFKREKFFIVALIPFIAGLSTFFSYFNFFSASDGEGNKGKNMSVMTYNVRIFDLYNWSRNLETREKIIGMLHRENPDILCLQEFFTSNDVTYNNLDTLKSILNASHAHTLFPVFLYGTDYWGIVTFSAFPIIKKEIVFSDRESANGCIATDVVVANDTIRIYNTHLQSVKLSYSNYKFVKNIDEESAQAKLEGIKQITVRLKKAFEKRAWQAETLASHIAACPYPVIMCGDFNDTPSSYSYKTIQKGLKDTFTERGLGISPTYIGLFPGLRIDYILHSEVFSSVSYTKLKDQLSDHYPVKVLLKF